MQGMVQRRILGAVPIVVLVHRGTKASMPSSGGHAGLDRGGVQMSSTDDTERLKTTEQFDLALIDGDHRLPGVTKDWGNYASLATMVAFHDIAWKRPADWKGLYRIDVPEFWAHVSEGKRTVEFCFDPTGEDNGIGVLWL